MSEQKRPRGSPRSRLSYSHGRTDLPGRKPFTDKAQPSRHEMNNAANPDRAAQLADLNKTEAERRRGSFMVKRQQPKPVLRPRNGLAHGVDRANFDRQWAQEQRRAKFLAEAIDVRRDLVREKQFYRDLRTQAKRADTPQQLDREAFKTKRRIGRETTQARERTQNLKRNFRDQ